MTENLFENNYETNSNKKDGVGRGLDSVKDFFITILVFTIGICVTFISGNLSFVPIEITGLIGLGSFIYLAFNLWSILS